MTQDKSCKTPRWRLLKSQLNNLSAKEFTSAVNASKCPVVIDVRTPQEFELGHFPNAININFFSDGLFDEIETLEKGKDYFIYCRSGRRSIRVCTWMRNGGFDNAKIFNLDTGFNDLAKQF